MEIVVGAAAFLAMTLKIIAFITQAFILALIFLSPINDKPPSTYAKISYAFTEAAIFCLVFGIIQVKFT